MAISRVPGYSLLQDLDRQGTDLKFTTNSQTLAYLDFANFRLGINTTTPQQALEVVGNVLVNTGHVYTSANLTYDLGDVDHYWRWIYAGNVSATSLNGTLTTAAQPNVTSLGTLTGLSIDGNLTVRDDIEPSGNLTGNLGFSNLWWSNLYAGTLNSTSIYGTLLTTSQMYITDMGNLTMDSLLVKGTLSYETITGNLIYGNLIYEDNNRVMTVVSNIQVTGDVTGYGNVSNVHLTLVDTGVVAGIYGSADDEYADRVPKITVDSKGRITNIANVTLTQVGNVTFTDTTISTTKDMFISTSNNGNIFINADGSTGFTQIMGSDAVFIPTGGYETRPNVGIRAGFIRYNSDASGIEAYNGFEWSLIGQQKLVRVEITPDGITDTFDLGDSVQPEACFVSINGTLQQSDTAYTISGNNIVFSETPLESDIVEVRIISGTISTIRSLAYGNAKVTLANDNITTNGNIAPETNNRDDLGSPTSAWHNIYITGAIVPSDANISIAPYVYVPVTIDSYGTASYRTAKYVIQATSLTDSESYEVMVTHNGSAAFTTTYGVINTGNTIGNIDATVSGSNVLVQYTAYTSNVVARVSKNYLLI